MELRNFAISVLEAQTLEGKLTLPPAAVTDDEPGAPVRRPRPVRPPVLAIAPARAREARVPPIAGMKDPAQRARILHALANHELQAAELFCWAILAFPEAPAGLRRGLAAICADEQRHCQMYIERIRAHGVAFGDYPVTGHFWNKLDAVRTPLQFICTMALTFENANLDFAQEYAAAARAAGDTETAAVLDQVHDEEIRHVRFGWHWLHQLAPQTSAWDTYLENITWPLGPARARGKTFDPESRRAAGLDETFIKNLASAAPQRPNGRHR